MAYNQTASINTPAIQTSAGTVLTSDINRSGFIIQNLGTNPLFVRLGAGASATVFHEVLKGSTGADDGTGGVFRMTEGTVYYGDVSVAGTSPRFVVTSLGE